MTEEIYQLAKQKYLDGQSLRQISEELSINRNSLSNRLKKDNITIKGNNPNQERRYTYKINEQFFDTLNDESCYVLGFFLADGSFVQNGIKFDQCISDKEILEKINNAMNSTYPIHEYAGSFVDGYQGQIMCRLNISRIKFKEKLLGLGFQENKTYSANIIDIPEKYEYSFIRGFFDGDGSASYETIHRTKYVSFTVHNEETMKFILHILKKNDMDFKAEYSEAKDVYTIIVRDYKNIEKFYNFCYTDTNIYLERKRRKIIEMLNM